MSFYNLTSTMSPIYILCYVYKKTMTQKSTVICFRFTTLNQNLKVNPVNPEPFHSHPSPLEGQFSIMFYVYFPSLTILGSLCHTQN